MKAALALALGIGCTRTAPQPELEMLSPGKYLEKVVTPHKGRPVAVNFWATWCEPCREEMPALLSAAARDKVDVTLVSLDLQRERDKANDFLRQMKASTASFMVSPGDPEPFINEVDKAWDGTIPYTLVYTNAGQIGSRLLGPHSEAQFRVAMAGMTRPVAP